MEFESQDIPTEESATPEEVDTNIMESHETFIQDDSTTETLSTSDALLAPEHQTLLEKIQNFIDALIPIFQSFRSIHEMKTSVKVSPDEEVVPSVQLKPPKSKLVLPKDKPKAREKSILRPQGSVPCRYSNSGCKEFVMPGNSSEIKHTSCCDFRPVPCIVEGCEEEIPYHSFLIHMNTHFIYPTYGSRLTASVVIKMEDFQTEGTWYPKWLSMDNHHFFLMLLRKEPGLWFSWVWFMGNDEEAEEFISRITYFKGIKCISGTYPVHSIQKSCMEIMETRKGCLLTSDDMMKTVTRIGDQVVTDLAMNIYISKQEKQLNDSAKYESYCKDLQDNNNSVPITTLASDFVSTSMVETMVKISEFVKDLSNKLYSLAEFE